MIEKYLWVFEKMIQSRLVPNLKNCNRILRILRDKNLLNKAKEVYRIMGQLRIKLTIVSYNTMLDSFCKEG